MLGINSTAKQLHTIGDPRGERREYNDEEKDNGEDFDYNWDDEEEQ